MNNRIYLRALELDDYKTSIEWRRDDEIWDMIAGEKHYVSEAYEKEWVQKSIFDTKAIKLAICLKSNRLHIGYIYIQDFDMINRSCSIAVMIGNKEYWKGGIATEAMRKMLKFMFEERGMNRVYSRVLATNIASIKMTEKSGLRKEGLLRSAIFKKGHYIDLVCFGILRDEFESEK